MHFGRPRFSAGFLCVETAISNTARTGAETWTGAGGQGHGSHQQVGKCIDYPNYAAAPAPDKAAAAAAAPRY
ncbi:hypothetical protein ACFQI7_12635 [Paenibacillus allorhizosphaerae]|uniref:Uncharacterized protein n=1 Tax=Paenibacillus allorhizosphaerae TaxID=2849866 RepID=A0ABM8VLR7_9BACL|nr:hypothetical protein [Paenibacillus allorhizosphaerae]CAG7648452.1 hypothetical protein PAECIP111802_04214 [Paenibacillus allorhizosphaerae]